MTPPFQGIEVPLVTVEHLAAFHLTHFGVPAPLDSFPASASDPTYADEANGEAGGAPDHASNAFGYEDYYDDDDDGLGYYPDGEKRTLTDEQIAMFRHSELARIFRAREIALENAEAQRDEDVTSERDPQDGRSGADLARTSEGEDGEIEEGEEVEDGARRAAQDPGLRNGRSASYQRSHATFQRSDVSPAKRKLSPGENEYSWPKKSRKAHIRYLDAAASEEQVLNYDDDEPASTMAVNAVASVPAVEIPRELADEKEGRKIWWPILGGS